MHGVIIAIEYSYKLDRKSYFNLWCELGRLLLRQSQMFYNRKLCSYDVFVVCKIQIYTYYWSVDKSKNNKKAKNA